MVFRKSSSFSMPEIKLKEKNVVITGGLIL
jgi:hypothetical protein